MPLRLYEPCTNEDCIYSTISLGQRELAPPPRGKCYICGTWCPQRTRDQLLSLFLLDHDMYLVALSTCFSEDVARILKSDVEDALSRVLRGEGLPRRQPGYVSFKRGRILADTLVLLKVADSVHARCAELVRAGTVATTIMMLSRRLPCEILGSLATFMWDVAATSKSIIDAKCAYNLPWLISTNQLYLSSHDIQECIMVYNWARSHHCSKLWPVRAALQHVLHLLTRSGLQDA